ncbi:6883_t:CDS:2, partial [Paraglomus occultum]
KIKQDIKTVQEQLKSFKSGTNAYLSQLYQSDKPKFDKLERDLSSFSTSSQTGSQKTPWGVIIPVSLVAVLIVAAAAVVINAFVIEILEKKKKILLGKTVLDEFACGGTGLHAATGPIFNPYNDSRHDTGDSIRRPASYCGIVGFKPSYGIISRAGIIPMASSLDTVGILAQKTQDIKSVFAITSQKDPHDLLTVATRSKSLSPKKNKIAVVAGIEKYLPNELSNLYHKTIEKLEKRGCTIEKITIPKKIREHLQITYLILCSSELVSHLNSLQGVTYGIKEN